VWSVSWCFHHLLPRIAAAISVCLDSSRFWGATLGGTPDPLISVIMFSKQIIHHVVFV